MAASAPQVPALAIMASKRAYDLLHNARPLVRSKNKHVVVALREVAARKIDFETRMPEMGSPSGETGSG